MGIDAFVYCKTCEETSECLGRAYQFKEEFINKELDNKIMEELETLIKRFELSLKKSIFSDTFLTEYNMELIDFWKNHREHNVWLLNDFGKEDITTDDKK